MRFFAKIRGRMRRKIKIETETADRIYKTLPSLSLSLSLSIPKKEGV
jgi:translation initiation factor IF-1